MLPDLILLSLAVFWGWETLRGILPFTLPVRVAPFLVAGMAFGASYLSPRFILAGACAGGVAIWRALISSRPLPPVSLPRRKPRAARPPAPELGKRVPRL